MDPAAIPTEENAVSIEQRRAAAKEAAQQRRKKLISLGPQFVEVIKLGQGFTRLAEGLAEEVFVWFVQEPGRSGALHWEPILAESEDGDASAALMQPKEIDPERTIKFSAISDIFMGRPNPVLKSHGASVNTKLCITFAVHEGSGDNLHLMARSRPQIEAWIYGIQHILKQGGFQFVEANDQLDKRERAIFEQFSAKQLVRLLMKKDKAIGDLRLQATLTHMNRGQSFARYLPDGGKEEVFVFFCADGNKGTLFWGHRSKPDGYLPLRTVTDMWLGKHGLLLQESAAEVDPARCVSLASKKAMLALEAPSKAVMTQWIYGIHSLLTASTEVLAEVNHGHIQHRQTATEDVAQIQAAIQQQQDAAVGSGAVDGDSAFQAEAAAVLNALRQLSLASGTTESLGLGAVEELDETILDQAAVAHANAIEAEADRLHEEVEAARRAREEYSVLKKQQDEAAKKSFADAGSAAESAIAASRALREAADARARQASQAVDRVMEAAAAAYAEGGDDEDEDEEEEEEAKEAEADANGGAGAAAGAVSTTEDPEMDDAEDARRRSQPRGRRLSLFSSLELDDDVRSALTFDAGALDGLDAELGLGQTAVEYTDDADAEAEADADGMADGEGDGADDDDWAQLDFDMPSDGEGAGDLDFVVDRPETDPTEADLEAGAGPDADSLMPQVSLNVDHLTESPVSSSPAETPSAAAATTDATPKPVSAAVAKPATTPSKAAAAAASATGSARRPIARKPTTGTASSSSGKLPNATGTPTRQATASRLATGTGPRPTTASSRLTASKSAASKSAVAAVPSTPRGSAIPATPRSTAKSSSTAIPRTGTSTATPTTTRRTAASSTTGPVRRSAASTAPLKSAPSKSSVPATPRSSAAASASSSSRAPLRSSASKVSIHINDGSGATPTRPRVSAAAAKSSSASTVTRPSTATAKSSSATGVPRVAGLGRTATGAAGKSSSTATAKSSAAKTSAAAAAAAAKK